MKKNYNLLTLIVQYLSACQLPECVFPRNTENTLFRLGLVLDRTQNPTFHILGTVVQKKTFVGLLSFPY